MEQTPSVITVGEALVEIMRPAFDQPLDQVGSFLGPFASGAPAIFAVAAARLGLEIGFVGGVGDDAFARLLRDRFSREGVDFSRMQVVDGYATAVAFVAYRTGGSREFVFHLRHAAAGQLAAKALDAAYFANARWLHLSGSTVALNKRCQEAAHEAWALTKAQGGKLSFDPNLRPELISPSDARALFAPFLQEASLLLPTVAEACLLTGYEDEEDAARALLAHGAELVALKLGAAGALFCTSEEIFRAPGFDVMEVDPTGAGDCFNAACVLGLQQAWPLRRLAQFATAAGALAVTHQGPMEGAPARTDIETLLSERTTRNGG